MNGTPTGRRPSEPEMQELPRKPDMQLRHPHGRVDNATYLDWVLKANGGVFPGPVASIVINSVCRNVAGMRSPVKLGVQ